MLATNEERIVTTPQETGTVQNTNTTPQVQEQTAIKPVGTAGTTAATTAGGTSSTASGSPSTSLGKANTGVNTETYENTMAALRQAQGMSGSFTSDYDGEIARLYNEIANRGKFSYDYSTDPLYNQYREQYTQLGEKAMRDTVGQTAALTGGYANSYSQAAGQQQYEAYLSRLNDVMPELYANAYNVWANEGNRLSQLYTLAGDQRDTAYQRYRDAMSDVQYNNALEIQQAMDRGALGDWGAYAEIYGEEAAKKAAILSNPQAAWASGLATGEEVYKYTGEYPIGYESAGGGGGSSGGGSGEVWGGYATGRPGPTPGYETSGIYKYEEGKSVPKW